jgi:hypothetical protein
LSRQELRQPVGGRRLKPERTAHANEPARLGLHSERRLLGGFRFDDRGAGVFEHLLFDLSQTDAAGRAIEQPYAKRLLQRHHSAAHPRLRKSERPRAGRKTAVLDDGRKEQEVVEIPHHCPPATPLATYRTEGCVAQADTGESFAIQKSALLAKAEVDRSALTLLQPIRRFPPVFEDDSTASRTL